MTDFIRSGGHRVVLTRSTITIDSLLTRVFGKTGSCVLRLVYQVGDPDGLNDFVSLRLVGPPLQKGLTKSVG